MQSFPYLVSLCRPGGAYASLCLRGCMATPCSPVSGDVGDWESQNIPMGLWPYPPRHWTTRRRWWRRRSLLVKIEGDPLNTQHAQHRPVAISYTNCKCIPGYTGTFNTICQPCVAGTWKSDPIAVSCTECPVGQYSKVKAFTSNTCTDCLSGQYQEETGSSLCKDCPAGSRTLSTGTPRLQDCLCDAGYGSDYVQSECESWTPGKYKDQIASVESTSCGHLKKGPTGSTTEDACRCIDNASPDVDGCEANTGHAPAEFVAGWWTQVTQCDAGYFKSLVMNKA